LVETAVLIKEAKDELVRYTLDFRANAINPHHKLVNLELLMDAHDAGLKVYPWTVNDAQTMKQLFSAGVDGLITDFPDIAADVLRKTD
ncbi:MAG: glycerophosphodiester phosphodiesterase, partial [Candidatus Thorarchaeota archaeon]